MCAYQCLPACLPAQPVSLAPSASISQADQPLWDAQLWFASVSVFAVPPASPDSEASRLRTTPVLQADQPLWDARAAVLLLLMARCACDSGALGALGGTAFFCGLLSEPDIRVRGVWGDRCVTVSHMLGKEGKQGRQVGGTVG